MSKWPRVEQALANAKAYFSSPLHDWKMPVDFSSERLASAAARFGEEEKYKFVEAIAERRTELAKTGVKLNVANTGAILAIFLSTFEKDVLIRAFGVSVSGINSVYELLLLLSSVLSATSIPISIHKICLDRALKYFFADHEEPAKWAISTTYIDSISALSSTIRRVGEDDRRNRHRKFGLIFLLVMLLFIVAIGTMSVAIYWVAIFYVLEHSAWPSFWVYVLISWVALVALSAFVASIYLFMPLRFTNWDAVDRVTNIDGENAELLWQEFQRLEEEKKEKKKRRRESLLF